MFTPLHNELSEALNGLREQQGQIEDAVGKLDEVTATAASKDRTVAATVNGQGKLTELEIKGTRWREMAPKEFAAKVVEAVAAAQEQAAAESTALMAGLLPDGMDLDKLREQGPDLQAMIDTALEDTGRWAR